MEYFHGIFTIMFFFNSKVTNWTASSSTQLACAKVGPDGDQFKDITSHSDRLSRSGIDLTMRLYIKWI